MYALRFPSKLRRCHSTTMCNWQTNSLYEFQMTASVPRNSEDNEGGLVYYNKEGFLAIQNAIAGAYIKVQKQFDFDVPNIMMQVSEWLLDARFSIDKRCIYEFRFPSN